MTCREVSRHLAGYLDGAGPTDRHANVRMHLENCSSCRADLESYRRLARVLASAKAMMPPADLATRIRVQASRVQVYKSVHRPILARARMFFEHILRPLAVPATGGLLTAAFVFVFLVQSLIVGMPMGNIPNDLPTDLIQPARLESLAPFPLPALLGDGNGSASGMLKVEATVNAEGEVGDYKILSGPDDAAIRHQIDQILIFSRFQPELNFGRPTSGGQVIVTFSEVRVRG